MELVGTLLKYYFYLFLATLLILFSIPFVNDVIQLLEIINTLVTRNWIKSVKYKYVLKHVLTKSKSLLTSRDPETCYSFPFSTCFKFPPLLILYPIPNQLGILAGLLFTYLGLYLMNGHGQPALLYLVPCTLGMSVLRPLEPKFVFGRYISFFRRF